MRKIIKRLSAVMLALIVAVTCMPLLGGSVVYAGGDVDLGNIIKGLNKDGTAYSGDWLEVSMSDLDSAYGGSGSFSNLYDSKKVDGAWSVGGTEINGTYNKSTKSFRYLVTHADYGKEIYFVTNTLADDSHYNNNSAYVKVSTVINVKVDTKGIATVTGKTNGANKFDGVRIDGSSTVLTDNSAGTKNFTFTFDTKKYSIGFHSLKVNMTDGSECNYAYKFATKIFDVPVLKKSSFETTYNDFTIKTGNFNSYKYDLYFDYKAGKNGKWQTMYGPLGPNSLGRINKLKANTTYYVRAYYVKEANGTYLIGPSSSAVAIKTGSSKKPAIKSIKISKAKVKKVWVKPIYNIFGVVIKKGYYAYQTTYKVTIRFKKKPGAAGIEVYAGGVTLPKYLKGNKKKYTTKFTVGGKATGKKTAFTIRVKGNKTYGQWSVPVTKKKIKIKK